MSMLPSQHTFDTPVQPLRRFKTGEDDGTPIYETRRPRWPAGVNKRAAVDYDVNVMTVVSANAVGSATTVKATLTMEPGAYDFLDENDQLEFDGNVWRVDSLVRPRGLWGAHHTEVVCSRVVNA